MSVDEAGDHHYPRYIDAFVDLIESAPSGI